jgi:OmpA-OmpF porin, OOP family
MIHRHRYTNCFKMCLILSVPLTLLAGCASGPTVSPALAQAQSAYARIEADPNIAANAEVAAYEAKKSLQLAEQATDIPTQEHLAYLAERKAQIAVALAEKNMAEMEIKQSADEKDKILLKARDLEIEKAGRELEAKEKKLERAAMEAEQARRQAELSKTKVMGMEAELSEAKAKGLEADLAKAQVKEMEAELAELKGKQTERGIVLTLGDVLFATGKANLMPGAFMTVEKLADFLEKHPDRNVLIEGHTDSVGKAEYNLFLSKRRADAVSKVLMDKGVGSERISTKGYGETYAVAGNDTAAGRQQNRRVEIVVLNPGASPEKMGR